MISIPNLKREAIVRVHSSNLQEVFLETTIDTFQKAEEARLIEISKKALAFYEALANLAASLKPKVDANTRFDATGAPIGIGFTQEQIKQAKKGRELTDKLNKAWAKAGYPPFVPLRFPLDSLKDELPLEIATDWDFTDLEKVIKEQVPAPGKVAEPVVDAILPVTDATPTN